MRIINEPDGENHWDGCSDSIMSILVRAFHAGEERHFDFQSGKNLAAKRIVNGAFVKLHSRNREAITREYEEFCDGDLDVGEHPAFHEWLMATLYDERVETSKNAL
jgi:hypothetical protein